jgi:hypothetical protein
MYHDNTQAKTENERRKVRSFPLGHEESIVFGINNFTFPESNHWSICTRTLRASIVPHRYL